MTITLQELAKKLNVSASTISRVVNGKNYVKPETRKKILKAVKEYNYSPNQAARSLKNKVSKTIGVVVPDISEDYFARVVKGIDSVLSAYGYSMILCDTGESSEKEEQYLNLLLQNQADGVILATVSKEKKSLYRLNEKGVSIVFFDNLPNVSINSDSVLVDNIKASSSAIEHLLELGHRKIGIIAGKQDETTGYERLAGYRKALNDHGIEVNNDLISIGDFKEKSGYDCMTRLLETNRDMTAVYVTSSKMTYGAIKAIKDKGLQIPGDIALVGFDVHDPTGLITPGITTIIQNEAAIGKMTAELLLRSMQKNSDNINQKILLEPQLIIRESCGSKRK